jgi:hypothetical protein
VLQLIVTANVVASLLILLTLIMKAILSSETSIITNVHGIISQKTTF